MIIGGAQKKNTKLTMQKQHPLNKLSQNENHELPTLLSSDNAFLEWVTDHGKTLIYAFLALLAFIFLFFRLTSGSKSKAESDYFNASTDFALFQRLSNEGNQTGAQEALERLAAIIQRHPELHAQYDGIIAQTLINDGNNTETKRYSLSTLKRISQNHLPYYEAYATHTLLISDKKYSEALTQAIDLKQKMIQVADSAKSETQNNFGSMLFALNLFRIGMLQQQMGNDNEELKTWQEWDHYINSQKPISGVAFSILNQKIADGKITLGDYIEQRQKVLKK